MPVKHSLTSNLSRTLVGNKIFDHSVPVGATPTTSTQRQLQDNTIDI